MGRPLLPIWNEFVTLAPPNADRRGPDVECSHCHAMVYNARPATLLSHVSRCTKIPAHVRLGLGKSDRPPKTTVTPLETQLAKAEKIHEDIQNMSQSQGESMEKGTTETEAPPLPTGPVLGKRARVIAPTNNSTLDTLEGVLTSIRDVMSSSLELKRQELQLRREELEFRKEALSAKLADSRQAREEERKDRREQREADRQEKMELARIENEKNLAFLKAVMESSAQQRR